MEFKEDITYSILGGWQVLIESDWNLKFAYRIGIFPPNLVLIESDWNLKKCWGYGQNKRANRINRIRLEFKEILSSFWKELQCSINRIRLEFKGNGCVVSFFVHISINRIRLEFKGELGYTWRWTHKVLIESDWNLKYIIPKPYDSENKGINRIRLEFKVAPFKAIHVFVSLY